MWCSFMKTCSVKPRGEDLMLMGYILLRLVRRSGLFWKDDLRMKRSFKF